MFLLLAHKIDYESFFYLHEAQFYFQDWRGLKAMVGRRDLELAIAREDWTKFEMLFESEEKLVDWITDCKWKRLTYNLYM